LMSSHLLAELELVCDYLILLSAGSTQLAGDIDEIRAGHRVLVGPREGASSVTERFTVIKSTHTNRQSRLIVRADSPLVGPAWEAADIGLEEIILAYMGAGDEHAADPRVARLRGVS
jgi:ABC-2 type transport system ATP-binding protein